MAGGGWAVAYRVKRTQTGMFHDDAVDVDEATARKVLGRCIRAGELGQAVEGEIIDAVRLLRNTRIYSIQHGTYSNEGWATVQEHEIGVLAALKAERAEKMATLCPPFAPDLFHPGVPCHPGAWGSETSCAMHAGYDLDENGLCVEGRRAVKLLDLVIVPLSAQKAMKLPQTLTREEAEHLLVYFLPSA